VVQNVDTTAWGKGSDSSVVVKAFDNDSESRLYQDAGLRPKECEKQTCFSDYLQRRMITNTGSVSNILKDLQA
jgi:hypothetical protein